MDLLKIKDFIESHFAGFTTVMEGDCPNVIGVSSVKVVSETQVIITDNYMNQSLKDINKNNNACLIFWDNEMKGYKLVGTVKYYTKGKWKEFVENMKENRGYPAKGAILMTVNKIIPSR